MSADVALGLPFNKIQCWFLLSYVAWLTGKRVGNVTHHCTNLHIYEDQWEGVEEQIERIDEGMRYEEAYFADTSVIGSRDFRFYWPDGVFTPLQASRPRAEIPTEGMLRAVDRATLHDFFIPGVRSCGPISFPFSV